LELVSLKEGVKRTLGILLEVSDELQYCHDELRFRFGIVQCYRRKKKWDDVGDVDIAIAGAKLADKFWVFLKALLERGFHSVWDVCDVPDELKGIWRPCCSRLEHPLSLTLDCKANQLFGTGNPIYRENKQYNLDLAIDARVIRKVPLSSKWMYGNPGVTNCNDPVIGRLHEDLLQRREFVDVLVSREYPRFRDVKLWIRRSL
jgi:hypothetical protein